MVTMKLSSHLVIWLWFGGKKFPLGHLVTVTYRDRVQTVVYWLLCHYNRDNRNNRYQSMLSYITNNLIIWLQLLLKFSFGLLHGHCYHQFSHKVGFAVTVSHTCSKRLSQSRSGYCGSPLRLQVLQLFSFFKVRGETCLKHSKVHSRRTLVQKTYELKKWTTCKIIEKHNTNVLVCFGAKFHLGVAICTLMCVNDNNDI